MQHPLARLAVVVTMTTLVGVIMATSMDIHYMRYAAALVVLLLSWYVTTSDTRTGVFGTIAAIGASISGVAGITNLLAKAKVLWFQGDYRLVESQAPVELVLILIGLTSASMMIATAEFRRLQS